MNQAVAGQKERGRTGCGEAAGAGRRTGFKSRRAAQMLRSLDVPYNVEDKVIEYIIEKTDAQKDGQSTITCIYIYIYM